jgi:PqqD family protein of HPr-rel-A system
VTAALRTRADVRFRVIAGEAVVLRQEAGETFVLNEVGARLLQWIAEGLPAAALPAQVAREFAVDEATAERDTDLFLSELVAAGIVEEVACPS